MDSDGEIDELVSLNTNSSQSSSGQLKLPKNYNFIVDSIEKKYSKSTSKPRIEGLVDLNRLEVVKVVKMSGRNTKSKSTRKVASKSLYTARHQRLDHSFMQFLANDSFDCLDEPPRQALLPASSSSRQVARASTDSGFGFNSASCSYDQVSTPQYCPTAYVDMSLAESGVTYAKTFDSKVYDMKYQYNCLLLLKKVISAKGDTACATIKEITRKIVQTLGIKQLPSADSLQVKPFIVFNDESKFNVCFIYDVPGQTFFPGFIANFFDPKYLQLQREIYSLIVAANCWMITIHQKEDVSVGSIEVDENDHLDDHHEEDAVDFNIELADFATSTPLPSKGRESKKSEPAKSTSKVRRKTLNEISTNLRQGTTQGSTNNTKRMTGKEMEVAVVPKKSKPSLDNPNESISRPVTRKLSKELGLSSVHPPEDTLNGNYWSGLKCL